MRNLLLFVLVLVAVPAMASGPGGFVFEVPNWWQPAMLGVEGFENWNAPTSAAALMGYWEDFRECDGLADGHAYPETIPGGYPDNPGAWDQGKWNDGAIEMGWYMNTGGWQDHPDTGPDDSGTDLGNIATGVTAYAAAAGYGDVSVTMQTSLDTEFDAMLHRYKGEIQAGRPVLLSLSDWGSAMYATPVFEIGKRIRANWWGFQSGQQHTAVGVGWFIDKPDDVGTTAMEYAAWASNYGASHASYGMGDHNRDGKVTDGDYTLWADHYDRTVDCNDYPQYVLFQANGVLWGAGDAFHYMAISVDRLEEIWLQNVYVDFGERGQLVPEPGAMALLGVAVAFFSVRKASCGRARRGA